MVIRSLFVRFLGTKWARVDHPRQADRERRSCPSAVAIAGTTDGTMGDKPGHSALSPIPPPECRGTGESQPVAPVLQLNNAVTAVPTSSRRKIQDVQQTGHTQQSPGACVTASSQKKPSLPSIGPIPYLNRVTVHWCSSWAAGTDEHQHHAFLTRISSWQQPASVATVVGDPTTSVFGHRRPRTGPGGGRTRRSVTTMQSPLGWRQYLPSNNWVSQSARLGLCVFDPAWVVASIPIGSHAWSIL